MDDSQRLANIDRQLKDLVRAATALNNTLVEIGRALNTVFLDTDELSETIKLSDGREIHTPATCDELCVRYRFGRGHDINCPTLKEKHYANDNCKDGHRDGDERLHVLRPNGIWRSIV